MYPSKDVKFVKLFPQGKAKLASKEDLERDKLGLTNPNLHRRIDIHDREFAGPETEYNLHNDVPQFEFGPRSYQLYVSGYNSYRYTVVQNHDEDTTWWEIP